MSGACLCLVVLLAVVSNQLAGGNLSKFWSLGVTSCASQDSAACSTCSQLGENREKILDQDQVNLCSNDSSAVRGIARGTRRAILDCQQQFSKKKWTCSTFFGNNLFGAFIANARTPETAVLYAYLTAGAVQGIAEDCQKQLVRTCPCVVGTHQQENDDEGNIIYEACNDNLDWAETYFEEFVVGSKELSNTDLGDRSDQHNIAVGKKIGGVRERFCTCHGLSGTCTVQTCYLKLREVSSIGEHMVHLYEGAVKVDLNPGNNELQAAAIPGATNVDALSADDLAYVDDSPDLCETDLSNGVLGTNNRDCDPLPGAANRCDSLCCGRGTTEELLIIPVEECQFVWCCNIECSHVRNDTKILYKCN